jgi:hypothetical protein
VSPSCAVVATQRGTVVAAAAAAHGCMEHKSPRSVGRRQAAPERLCEPDAGATRVGHR